MVESSVKKKRLQGILYIYYSKPEIQKNIFEFCENREIAPSYMMESFGKRPDTLQYQGDLFELVKKGATSFHCSEEIWEDPLRMSSDFSEEDFNQLREGWDLLLDVDCKYFDFAKMTAEAIIETLNRFGVENVGLKFSVSGDTPILVQENKEMSLVPIKNVIEKLKKGKGLNILSLDKNQKLKFSEIYDYLEHKDDLYEIKHSQSTLPIKTTKHHSVFVWDKGEIIQKKVTALKKEDFLISFNTKENPFVSQNIEIVNKFEFAKNQHSKKTISRKIKVTKDLMRLIGYFLAEGHTTDIINQTGFSFHREEKDYIGDVASILKKLTGRKISIRHPNPNSTQILIHSKEWLTFFNKFCGKKKDKHVPNFVFQAPRELFLEMLKGYIRGDGYKKGEYGIIVKSVSKKLVEEMIWLCKLNDISCNLSYEQNKPHKLPQGNSFKGSLVYMLKIPKSELKKMEFYRGRNKFSPYAGDKLFPVDGLKEVYKQIKPKMFNHHRPEQMTLKKKKANLIRIKKVLNWFENFKEFEINESSKIILKNYNKIFDSDISVVEINEIIKKEKESVYDVSVKDTESFFGNSYPILLHNSGSKGFHILIPWKAFPKEINGIKTSNLFPKLPRKIIGFIRDRSQKVFKEKLPEDFYYQFKDAKIKKGIKCKKCDEIVDVYEETELYCPFCKIAEIRKIPKGSLKKGEICPECKRKLEIKKVLEIFECKKCKTNSKTNPENFSSSEEVDLFDLMGLDLILVSSRHLFRTPYSLHEKTGLSSVVLTKEELKDFEPKDANPLKVRVRNFMPNAKENEAAELVMEALDWAKNKEIISGNSEEKITGKYANFKPIKLKEIKDEEFPPSIKKILEGLEDGRKRAVFILMNTFRSIGMEKDELEKKLFEWNKRNKPSLKEGYIKSQLKANYKRKPIFPPNFDSDYYKALGLALTEEEIRMKNPVIFIIRKNLGKNKTQKRGERKNSEGTKVKRGVEEKYFKKSFAEKRKKKFK